MSFTYNGEIADQTEVWEPGGAPADLVNGIELSVTGPPAPTAPDTGNAGFALDEGGVSPWLALSLGGVGDWSGRRDSNPRPSASV